MVNKIRIAFIIICIGIGIFITGYSVHRFHFFPYEVIEKTAKTLSSAFQKKWYYKSTYASKSIQINTDEALNWPSIITCVGENDSLIVKIILNDGQLLHQWNVEWFDLWKDANHLPEESAPHSRPGTMIHGIELLEDGAIVFNFENLGLICLDKNGITRWKLPHLTHHSIQRVDSILWVCSSRYRTESLEKYPNYIPPFIEPTIIKVTIDGKLLEEISVFDLLDKNNLHGLLSLPTTTDLHTKLTGDIMHLNDVELFTPDIEEGLFKHGDVMVSLRNLNAILFYNDSTKKVKNFIISDFVRQHDPDFIDGNTISLFDNFNIGSKEISKQSRILIKSFIKNGITEYYSGNDKSPFNSNIMGKHQWLQNGNLLITDSMNGRAIEVNKYKNIVWEYLNLLPGGKIGIVQEVTKISPKFIDIYN